ncbi:MAG: thermonuclease family protein [Rhodospirillales bacterium]
MGYVTQLIKRRQLRRRLGIRQRRRWPDVLLWIAILLAGATLYLNLPYRNLPTFPASALSPDIPAAEASGNFPLCEGGFRHDCVVDGDTIWYGGTKIRLADIDAPEVPNPKCASEAALGRQATERLVELMNEGPFEVTPASGRDEDGYGRKLRVIERRGRSLGDILVAEGLARPWDGGRRSWCR